MPTLFRIFTHREHAERLIAGDVRFGHLDYYRRLELDNRAGRGDASEGRAHFEEYRAERTAVRITGRRAEEIASPGIVTVRSELGNDIWICSCAAPPDETATNRIRDELGGFMVEIEDSEKFVQEIRAALKPNDPWQRGACVMAWPVEYTKGEQLAPRSHDERLRLAVVQKPRVYEYQCEFRIALISYGSKEFDGAPPDFLTVRLGHPIEYARIVSVPRLAIP